MKVKYYLGGALLAAFFCFVCNFSATQAFAQEDQAAPPEAAPAAEAPAAPETAQAPTTVLALEKAASAAFADVLKDLKIDKKFVRRLPSFWRDLRVTKRQTNAAYAIQEEYHAEISQLTARVKRLEAERDAKIREILSEKQRAKYDEKVKAAEDAREAKRAAREAAEEAALEAELDAE